MAPVVLVGPRSRTAPAVVRRWTIQALLVECGMPRDLVYVDRRPRGTFSRGWEERLPLDELAFEAHRAFRRRVKTMRPDLPGDGNKRRLIEARNRLQKWFARRGVRL